MSGPAEQTIRAKPFIAAHRTHWERLSLLLDRVEREGLATLEAEELEELARLYVRAGAHLSEARSADYGAETVNYLNQLVSRAYARIYASGRRRRLRLGRLFSRELPLTFRRRARYIAVSTGLSVVVAVMAYLAVRADPRWARAFANEGAVAMWEAFARSGDPAGKYFAETAESAGGPEFATFVMSNNIRVALNAFALGVTLGLGTAAVLVLNGLMVGAFFGVGGNAGEIVRFAAVVAPHGVTEVSAVFIAGAGGFVLGHALADPGDLLRRDALRVAAVEAVRLALGAVPMFVVAGIIEGMVSPQSAGLFGADVPRILFGLLVAAAFWLWLFFGDRLWGGSEADHW